MGKRKTFIDPKTKKRVRVTNAEARRRQLCHIRHTTGMSILVNADGKFVCFP